MQREQAHECMHCLRSFTPCGSRDSHRTYLAAYFVNSSMLTWQQVFMPAGCGTAILKAILGGGTCLHVSTAVVASHFSGRLALNTHCEVGLRTPEAPLRAQCAMLSFCLFCFVFLVLGLARSLALSLSLYVYTKKNIYIYIYLSLSLSLSL